VAPTPFGQAGLFGGGERYPLELARALARHVDCELIIFGRSARTEHDPSGLRVRTLRAIHWLGGHPAHPLALTLPAALAGATVIHTHHLRSTPSRIAALTARARRTPVYVTDHGLQGNSWGGLLPRFFDGFLTVSAYSARELGAPASRTRVIYGGADPTHYFPDAKTPRDAVLFVGRLTPHKGVDRLLQALPENASARIVGTPGHDPRPPEREYPSLLRSLAEGHNVEFLHTVSDAELPHLYRSASVFVLPSVERTCYGRTIRISELLGLSLLEAMASGTPVIASAVGGVPEIVRDGETGFLVPPGDVSALRERMAEVLGDDRLAKRMGANARAHVLAGFTWEKVAERCLAGYSDRLHVQVG
jgi:alpha-maltose-1-phosphate synthase